MRSVITKKRLITAAVTLVIMVSVFLAGAHRGYDLGYTDGENTANGWWIDKKSRYYESAEVIKKRINLKYNQDLRNLGLTRGTRRHPLPSGQPASCVQFS